MRKSEGLEFRRFSAGLVRAILAITGDDLASMLAPAMLADLGPFYRVQLAHVVETCRASRSLSEAGRPLFAASRRKRASTNDADRLRKYLARFELAWADVSGG